ncbi:MAG: 4'-phosphopantetheinyl transferase superfamily protein, partial [bacterium]|nr:4'-phosphopantetheinyl transferase superfamily protein [bacterium]
MKTLKIPDNTVHIWSCRLTQHQKVLDKLNLTLSDDERKKADRFHFKHHKNGYIVCRGVLRKLLSIYLDTDPGKILFKYNKYGKPEYKAEKHSDKIYFNISHSKNICILGFSKKIQTGVDIEYVRTISSIDKIAERFFSKKEYNDFKSAKNKKTAFFSCWTRKEAFIKAMGNGLYHPLHSFDVTLLANKPAKILSIDNCPDTASEWTLYDLPYFHKYKAAVVVKAVNTNLIYN